MSLVYLRSVACHRNPEMILVRNDSRARTHPILRKLFPDTGLPELTGLNVLWGRRNSKGVNLQGRAMAVVSREGVATSDW